MCVYTRYKPFAHSSCTCLLILLFIKSTVYCPTHFILLCFLPIFMYILLRCVLHCLLSGPDLTYISLLIIFCIIEYVTNKTLNPWIQIPELSIFISTMKGSHSLPSNKPQLPKRFLPLSVQRFLSWLPRALSQCHLSWSWLVQYWSQT